MFFQVFFAGGAEFDGDEFVASLFESADDVTDKASLDTIGFDGDEGSFGDASFGHF